jgi:hypothetical protein
MGKGRNGVNKGLTLGAGWVFESYKSSPRNMFAVALALELQALFLARARFKTKGGSGLEGPVRVIAQNRLLERMVCEPQECSTLCTICAEVSRVFACTTKSLGLLKAKRCRDHCKTCRDLSCISKPTIILNKTTIQTPNLEIIGVLMKTAIFFENGQGL